MRMFHLVLPKAKNEVIGQLLDPVEDVDSLAFLRLRLSLFENLGHPAQHLNIICVIHCSTH